MRHTKTVVLTAVLLITAVTLAANPGGSGNAMNLVVAPDGTVLTFRPVDAGTPGSGMELVAIRDGALVWSRAGGTGFHGLAMTPSAVIVAEGRGTPGVGPTGDVKTKITALSLVNGNPVWSVEIDGSAMHFEVVGGKIYAIATQPGSGASAGPGTGHGSGMGPGSGMGSGTPGMGRGGIAPGMGGSPRGAGLTRTLYVFDEAGALLWSFDLSR
jgi:hypothetical protein